MKYSNISVAQDLPEPKSYQLLPTSNVERLWSFAITDDGKTALTGYGRDEARIVQTDLDKRQIDQTYQLPGRYVLSIDIHSNDLAIAGTNNGHLVLIDLKDALLKHKAKIATEKQSVKGVKFSADGHTLFAITSTHLFAVTTANLTVLAKCLLEFDPWDILLIPNTDMLSVSGSNNQLDLYQFGPDNAVLKQLDSATCGPVNKDVSSVVYNENNDLLISTSESGFLDFWSVSTQRLIRQRRIDIQDRLYWLDSVDDLVSFSGSKQGLWLYDIKNDLLVNVAHGRREGRQVLRKIKQTVYLLYQTQKNDILVADLTHDNWHDFRLTDLPGDVSQLTLTDNADVIAFTNEEVLLSKLFDNKTPYIQPIEDFITNQNSQSVLTLTKNATFEIRSLLTERTTPIDLNNIVTHTHWEIKDFSADTLLFSTDNQILCLTIPDEPSADLSSYAKIHEITGSSSIKNIRLIGDDHFAILFDDDYDVTPCVEPHICLYNKQGQKVSQQNLGLGANTMFTAQNMVASSDRNAPSTITDLQSNKTLSFDIGYVFFQNDVIFSDDMGLCLHLSCDELCCFDINDKNNKIWQVEDPKLMSYSLVDYNRAQQNFLIVDKTTGDLLAVSADNGHIVNGYQLPAGLEKISLSNDGQYILWQLRTGEFSATAFPLTELKSSELVQSWRSNTHYDDVNAAIKLTNPCVAQLWLHIQKRMDNMEFRSSQSAGHQLDPCGFSLTIPNIQALAHYNKKNATTALLGLTSNNTSLPAGNSDVATIYHELFHVFQANATRCVFDYFYLVDHLQQKRTELLGLLGKIQFFSLADDEMLESCLSVFHCADNTGIEPLKQISDLNLELVEDLTKYFAIPGDSVGDSVGDSTIHTFEIIEGSAEVFGLCCGGFDAFAQLDQRLEQLSQSKQQMINNEMYLKAYKLFKSHHGQTPIVFLIQCLLSLRYGSITGYSGTTPADIFIWCLARLEIWEDLLNDGMTHSQPINQNFEMVSSQLIETMSHAIEGQFYTVKITSIHDEPQTHSDSIFMQSIANIRTQMPASRDITFIIDLVLNEKTPYALAKQFMVNSAQLASLSATHEVVYQFEKLLMHGPEGDFSLNCCPRHGEVGSTDDWVNCTEHNSFKNQLLSQFNITVPDYFL